jgi:hypothetical protein
MNVTRQEASEALDAIGSANRRVRELKGYREAWPFFIVWGLVYLVANAATHFWPQQGGRVWLVSIILGTAASALVAITNAVRDDRANSYTVADRQAIGRRWSMLGSAVIGFFVAMFIVLWPLEPRQQNAFISLFWSLAYMAAGAWVGTRLFVTGLVTAVAIVFGYVYLTEHYFLWMALVGGGSLLLGGLWMRKL